MQVGLGSSSLCPLVVFFPTRESSEKPEGLMIFCQFCGPSFGAGKRASFLVPHLHVFQNLGPRRGPVLGARERTIFPVSGAPLFCVSTGFASRVSSFWGRVAASFLGPESGPKHYQWPPVLPRIWAVFWPCFESLKKREFATSSMGLLPAKNPPKCCSPFRVQFWQF